MLFRSEVPEIENGTVKIMGIASEEEIQPPGGHVGLGPDFAEGVEIDER